MIIRGRRISRGDRKGTAVVWVDGRKLSPLRSLKVWNHSPDGFEWGYAGSGPAQLALALLLDAGVAEDRAVDLHQDFKLRFIAVLPAPGFTLELDVAAWADRHQHDHKEIGF